MAIFSSMWSLPRIRDREAKTERQTRLEAPQTATERTNWRDQSSLYRYGLKALYARFGASMGVSKADCVARTVKAGFTIPRRSSTSSRRERDSGPSLG